MASDYEKYIALKSLFHALRIRDYGIQIATDNKITKWGNMNHVLTKLLKFGEEFERSELWDKCNESFGGENKSLRSRFVDLCPKSDNHEQKKDKLKKIFKHYNIYDYIVKTPQILDDIIRTLGDK